MAKKMQSYRMDEGTIEIIDMISGLLDCSKSEAIECAMDMVVNSGLFQKIAITQKGRNDKYPTAKQMTYESFKVLINYYPDAEMVGFIDEEAI